jgi:hypothetical protein
MGTMSFMGSEASSYGEPEGEYLHPEEPKINSNQRERLEPVRELGGAARMGLARRDQGARWRRCRYASSTTSNAEIARNPPAPSGFRRRGGICCVGAPRRCAPTSPASRRLASVPARSAAGGTVLGTRPLLILGRKTRDAAQFCAALACMIRRVFAKPGSVPSFPIASSAIEKASAARRRTLSNRALLPPVALALCNKARVSHPACRPGRRPVEVCPASGEN